MPNKSYAQISTLTNPQTTDGYSNTTNHIGSPVNRQTHSSSSTPLTVTPFQKEQLSNETKENTLGKPNTPLSNSTISPPPNGSQAVIKNSSITKNSDNYFINTITLMKPKNFLVNYVPSFFSSSDATNKLILKNQTVTPANFKNYAALPLDIVDEPSVATNGHIIFFVGNHYTARSTDGGNTFSFNTDPSIKDTTDQKVIYDKTNHMFIWFQQGQQKDDGTNDVFFNISHDAINWWTYVLNPSTIFGPQFKNTHIDFPHLALTNRSLYYASNLFDQGSVNNFNRSFIMKISLNDLANADDPSFTYYYSKIFGLTPVQGATDTMYFAGPISNARMAIYKWSDADPPSKVIRYEENIDPWKTTKLNYECYTHENATLIDNYCGHSDDRILTGWISNGKVGWMWNVDKDQADKFPWPYADAAVFNVENMKYLGRPLLWSSDYAFQYPAVFPGANGSLGLITTFGGNTTNPSIGVAYSTNQPDNMPKWQIIPTVKGKSPGYDNDTWGDYLSIQPYNSNNDEGITTKFIAAGYTVQSNGTSKYIMPQLILFGK